MKKNVKIYTDNKLIEKFLNRGVETILPSKKELQKKLKSGKRLSAYMGFDPTGPYLHVGHAMGIRALRVLQQLGHRVIFLVGDYTARVGDPTDKKNTRELLTPEKISKNMKEWKTQASQLIDFDDKQNPVEFLHNFNWLSKLKLDNLIELMSTMTVQQMLERDMFQNRLNDNKPIKLQEFIYPLMQGYDSVAMDIDIELGGTDQIFNMMVGRDLVKHFLKKEKFVRAQIMMPAPDNITMSKTKGNGINLSDSGEDMYGKAMSYSDEHIITGLKLLTDLELEEITEIENSINSGENPMKYKKLMSYKIVKTIKGKKIAQKAEKHFEDTIQKGKIDSQRTKISLKKLEQRLAKLSKQNDTITIISELLESSKGKAKRLLKQKAIEINGNKLSQNDSEIKLKINDIIKIGKRNWFEIVE